MSRTCYECGNDRDVCSHKGWCDSSYEITSVYQMDFDSDQLEAVARLVVKLAHRIERLEKHIGLEDK